jgi:alkanesulfonate monooxygenase SsuD/methylene tetrahydromethanopterin reductase-like flavin-dependent oxidoreductase (luciferase family)
MWSDNDGPYNGRHYQLAETLCSPRPLTRPHPPILIGGGGEKRTLLLVARYADACNLFATSPTEVAHKLHVLRRHCDDEGRDYDSITKTALYVGPPVLDNTDRFLADAEHYATLGITELEVMPDRDPVEFATQLVDAISPRLDAID